LPQLWGAGLPQFWGWAGSLGLGFWVARSGSSAGSGGLLSALEIFTDFYALALAFLS
tara:strand:- start:1175 stop:1345 length:171 start_codon:yes stop_codon:yes gene_type:complete